MAFSADAIEIKTLSPTVAAARVGMCSSIRLFNSLARQDVEDEKDFPSR